jgi:cytochrome c oxidase cbb3-type subunit III
MKVAIVVAALLALGGCERELRVFSAPQSALPPAAPPPAQSQVQPGQAGKGLSEEVRSANYAPGNAYSMSQGKKLFRWYNCSGCHSNGGGGMGPALMDNRWRHGHEPDAIFATIMDGRPNGMPSFRGRIPEDQAWQLVAYVRSMSGLASRAAAPGRSDALYPMQPESRRPRIDPVPEPAQ